MPEEALETQDLKERLEEAEEHAHGHAHGHSHTTWLTWLSLSTAILAVLAAISSLESGSYANDAIVQKNDAVLHQSKADDLWAYYQAKNVQMTIYTTQAALATSPALAAEWRADADRKKQEIGESKKGAEEQEKVVVEDDEKSEHSLHVHHQFAKSVTIFQVSIALAAIAALTRKKATWWVSLAVGGAGVVFFAMGFLAH